MTEKKQYVLRTCNADGTSRNGFKWPKRGKVEAPDWDSTPECGKGLHGALWGEGDSWLLNWSVKARWQVVRVDSELVDLGGKVKFQRGYVVFTGTRKAATDKILSLGAKGAVIGAFVTSGDCGTSTSGYKGTSTSGDHGTSISGENGTSTSEDFGTSISGNKGTSTSGYKGISTSGHCGTSTSGHCGNSTSGDYGKSTSGDHGISISGRNGTIQIEYWCTETNRKKIKTGYIGEDGLKPNVAYKLDDSNEFVETRCQRKNNTY